jgi:hypothetical protein
MTGQATTSGMKARQPTDEEQETDDRIDGHPLPG